MPDHEPHPMDQLLKLLETALERPVVPGELTTWADEVDQCAHALGGPLRDRIERQQPGLFRQIVEEDPALRRRTEQLRQEGRGILRAFDEFVSSATSLAEQANELEPDEARASEQIRQVSDSGLALVLRIRKQDLAVQTWLGEAAVRDRGVKD